MAGFRGDAGMAIVIEQDAPVVRTTGIFTTVAHEATDAQLDSVNGADRWLNGIKFRPWPTPDVAEVFPLSGALDSDNCGDEMADLTLIDTCQRETYFFCPFLVNILEDLGAIGNVNGSQYIGPNTLRVNRSLELARVLEVGSGDNSGSAEGNSCTPGLVGLVTADNDRLVTAATGEPMVRALAALEQATGFTSPTDAGNVLVGNRRATVVMSVAAQTFLASERALCFEPELDAWVTPAGNVVLADAGFSGLIPTSGASTADLEGMYLVPDIYYKTTDVRTFDAPAADQFGAAGEFANHMQKLSQFWAIIFFDPSAVIAAVGTYASA